MKTVQGFLRQEGYHLPEAGEAPDVGNGSPAFPQAVLFG